MLTLRTMRNSKRVLRNGMFRVVFVSLLAIVAGQAGGMTGTNAFFSDTEGVTGNSVEAAVWIPTLHASVSPASPDGQDDATLYKTHPCVTLSYDGLSSGTATIWYEFSDDGDPAGGGTVYDGSCIGIPDGDPVPFQAVAVNDADPDWKSAVLSQAFKVDTECPEITLEDPGNGDTVSGTVKLRGTLSDAHPHHYWLVVVKKSTGATVAGPGTVNDSDTFSDKILYDWDTTKVSDGDYIVKFEARDAAGNKCNDKSFDWNTVTVRNAEPEPEAEDGEDSDDDGVMAMMPVQRTFPDTLSDGGPVEGDSGNADDTGTDTDDMMESGGSSDQESGGDDTAETPSDDGDGGLIGPGTGTD